MRPILILKFLFLYVLMLQAQEFPVSFQRYYSKDGLSSNTIYSIYRDTYGFLWLGTEDGLNRFDGNKYKVYRYDANNEFGLRANNVTAICEDNAGRIWIGTNGGGLSYYDRQSDIIHSYERTPENRWLSTAITAITKDAIGNIWVSSYGGIFIINANDPNKNLDSAYSKIVTYFFGKLSRYVFKDKSDNIWVSSNGILYKISKNLDEIKEFKMPSNYSGVTINEITTITEDHLNRIWAGASSGLFLLDSKATAFKSFEEFSDDKLSSKKIYALGNDKKGGVWVGTDSGLDIVNPKTFTIESFKPNTSNINSLSHKSIRSIYADNYGIYWVGTFQGGLNKYDTNLSQFGLKAINMSNRQNEVSNMVTSFYEYQNKVILGVDAGGVYQYDRQLDRLSQLNLNIAQNLTVLTLEGYQDKLWIGTYQKGVIEYDFKNKTHKSFSLGEGLGALNHNEIFSLKRDYLGNLWIGTNGGGINIRYQDGTIKKFLSNNKAGTNEIEPAGNFIRIIKEDHEKNMWIGTYGSGLSVYNPSSKRNVFYDRDNSGLPSNYVLAIHVDKNGTAYVGTNGNGVGVLKKGETKFTVISEVDGLINGVIQNITEANDGKIWFSTNRGLSCYDVVNKSFKNFTQSAGLQEGAFMLGAGLKLADGEIFFGGQNGFNHFYPENLKTNKNPALVVLTDLKIDNKIVFPSDEGPIKYSLQESKIINLKYKQNFSISFAALNLTIPEDNQYEYRLVGFDKNWIQGGKELSAYYTNLDPGEYTFEVKASNNDGIWSEEITSVKISVAPPFWRTIYAYVFYLMAAVGSILYLRHRGIQNLKQKFAIEQERVQAKQLIEQQKREAETLHKLDQMKIKFLTNLSHEFRTPISLIMGPIETLIHQIQDLNARSQLDLVKRNAKRLLNLVNQLLDFRKMEEHELKLQNSDGDLVAFVKDVFHSFNDMALQKGIDYSFYTSQDKLYASFDEDKIERILFNLISNAFKFTAKGGDIAISILSTDYLDDNKIKVYFEIRDTGIGIPIEAQGSIFESFFQHDTAGKVLNQGSGIGLSIADSFVRMYNGKIQVDSIVGKGSAFSFDLILDDVEESYVEDMFETIEVEEEVFDHDYRNKATLLIVEDDDDFRDYLRNVLSENYKVLEAVNGKEGWQKALFHHPDIIICDVQMPVMNGMELSQKMAQDKRTKHIPIVLMTASKVENGLVCGLESGAVDYITKPFDINVLLAKINSLMILNQAFKDVYSKQVSIATPEVSFTSEKDKFLHNVLTYIYDNIDNPQLSVESLSSHLYISRASLYNRLLEYTGMSPVDFIRSVKLEKAANLLEKSDKTISEIAYETGFANPNYFTKVFKAKYQMTPSEYINSLKKYKV